MGYSIDTWENPAEMPREQEELALLLKDYTSGFIKYRGTTETDIQRAEQELEHYQDHKSEPDTNQLVKYYELLLDYCFGNIMCTIGDERNIHFRRGKKCLEIIDKLKPDDRGASLRGLIIQAIKKGKDEKRGQGE